MSKTVFDMPDRQREFSLILLCIVFEAFGYGMELFGVSRYTTIPKVSRVDNMNVNATRSAISKPTSVCLLKAARSYDGCSVRAYLRKRVPLMERKLRYGPALGTLHADNGTK
jgi:hypothetical protein